VINNEIFVNTVSEDLQNARIPNFVREEHVTQDRSPSVLNLKIKQHV